MTLLSTVPNLSTTLAGGEIKLPTCLYNASGPRSGTAAALRNIYQSRGTGAVLTKSATLTTQTGNPQPRTWHSVDGQASLNSEGLPNNGIDYYISAETIQDCCGDDVRKPYMISLSGKTMADNLEMLQRVSNAPTRHRIAAVELNLACPNVIGKPIIGYDLEQMKDIFQQLSDFPAVQQNQLPPIGVKLPPYFDVQHFTQVAELINQYCSIIRFVVTINTLGNAFAIDSTAQAPVLASNSGFAGLSGPVVKYTALANCRKLRSLLHSNIDVVGVGGIACGQDVLEMLLAGASAVQIATCHWKEGPICFDRIQDELIAIMSDRGYTSVQLDVVNKLQDWSKERAAVSRKKKVINQNGAGAVPNSLNATRKNGCINNDVFLYKSLCGVLIVLIAILCADKWNLIK